MPKVRIFFLLLQNSICYSCLFFFQWTFKIFFWDTRPCLLWFIYSIHSTSCVIQCAVLSCSLGQTHVIYNLFCCGGVVTSIFVYIFLCKIYSHRFERSCSVCKILIFLYNFWFFEPSVTLMHYCFFSWYDFIFIRNFCIFFRLFCVIYFCLHQFFFPGHRVLIIHF